MKRATLALIVAGFVLEVVALGIVGLGGFFERATITPRSAAMKNALESLSRSGTLSPDDPGFPVLASIFLAQLAAQNPEREVDVNVTAIEKTPGNRSAQEASIEFTLSNGQSLDWKVSALESHVETLASALRLWIAAAVFLLGGVLQVVAFALRARSQQVDPEAL